MIEYRWTWRGDRLLELTAELVGLKPDLIVTVSHRVSLAAKRATTTLPIVFAAVNDPVGVGLVPSLAHPGGNVTGLSTQGRDRIAKRLELLKDLLPSGLRVALPNYHPYVQGSRWRRLGRARQCLGPKRMPSLLLPVMVTSYNESHGPRVGRIRGSVRALMGTVTDVPGL